MTVPSHTAAPDGPLASILLVEDDPDCMHAVRQILEREGYRVESAVNGSVALDRLLCGLRPDLIVVDLLMPVMGGSRFIVELKARPELAVIPVVVTSGAGERTLVSAPVSAAYLEKPLTRARLLETVAACLVRSARRASGVPPIGR